MKTLLNVCLIFGMGLAISSCEAPSVPQLSAEDVIIDEGNGTEAAPREVSIDYTTSAVALMKVATSRLLKEH